MYVLDVGVSKTKYWQKSRSSWFASRERRFLCLMRFHAVIQPFQWQSEPNPLQISLITSMALKTHNVLHRFLDLCLGQGVRDTHTHTNSHTFFFFSNAFLSFLGGSLRLWDIKRGCKALPFFYRFMTMMSSLSADLGSVGNSEKKHKKLNFSVRLPRCHARA